MVMKEVASFNTAQKPPERDEIGLLNVVAWRPLVVKGGQIWCGWSDGGRQVTVLD